MDVLTRMLSLDYILFCIFILIFTVVVGASAVFLRKPTNKKEDVPPKNETPAKYPYILTNSVFTPKEKLFYNSLKKITDELGLTVFTKMRIADLVYLPRNHPEYMRWFNYIKAKHVDFIICDNAHRPLLIIECDDKTHYRQSRKKRDEFVDEIFRQLNFKVIHIMTWNDTELKQLIFNLLNITTIEYKTEKG